MKHSLKLKRLNFPSISFALNSSDWTLQPLDPEVTTIGGFQMSPQDIQKLNSAYNCGTNGEYNGCGGSLIGTNGTLESRDFEQCEWFITVKDGALVRLQVMEIQV